MHLMKCDLEYIDREPTPGWRWARCRRCMAEFQTHSPLDQTFRACTLSAEIAAGTEYDPTLIGNRLAELFSAIGIPPCDGCNKRKRWFNKAHVALREMFGASAP